VTLPLDIIPKFFAGQKQLSAEVMNSIVDHLKTFAKISFAPPLEGIVSGDHLLIRIQDLEFADIWLGQIVLATEEETEYTDARYFVTNVKCTSDDEDATSLPTFDLYADDDPKYLHVTAVNMDELDAGTHNLEAEKYVLVMTLIDDSDPYEKRNIFFAGGSSSLDADGGTFVAHYSVTDFDPGNFPDDTGVFWSLNSCDRSFLSIAVELRQCEEDLPLGDHPGYSIFVETMGFDNELHGFTGDDDTWFEMAYTVVDKTGNITGNGIMAEGDINVKCRISDAGTLDFKVENESTFFSGVLAVAIRRNRHVAAPGTLEIGAGGCHDDTTWGDGVWEPGV